MVSSGIHPLYTPTIISVPTTSNIDSLRQHAMCCACTFDEAATQDLASAPGGPWLIQSGERRLLRVP
jgi:hypothetical protein